MRLFLGFNDETNTWFITELQIRVFCHGHLGFLLTLLFGGSVIYTTLGYIVSQILLNLGHVFRFRIVSCMCQRNTCSKFKRISETILSRVTYIFDYKMFHQEVSVETIKMVVGYISGHIYKTNVQLEGGLLTCRSCTPVVCVYKFTEVTFF